MLKFLKENEKKWFTLREIEESIKSGIGGMKKLRLLEMVKYKNDLRYPHIYLYMHKGG